VHSTARLLDARDAIEFANGNLFSNDEIDFGVTLKGHHCRIQG